MGKELKDMEKTMIEDRASKTLKAFRYTDGKDNYVDSVKLARFFGFNVMESSDLPPIEDGSITVSGDGKEKVIVVNNVRSFESKRFIITHELAHYLLHYNGSGKLFMHRENVTGKNLEENDADYLAACLLMPPKSFKSLYDSLQDRSTEGKIARLQLVFRTPRESIERRIEEVCNGRKRETRTA